MEAGHLPVLKRQIIPHLWISQVHRICIPAIKGKSLSLLWEIPIDTCNKLSIVQPKFCIVYIPHATHLRWLGLYGMKFGPEMGSTPHLEQMIIAKGSRTSIKREEDSAGFLLAFFGGGGLRWGVERPLMHPKCSILKQPKTKTGQALILAWPQTSSVLFLHPLRCPVWSDSGYPSWNCSVLQELAIPSPPRPNR